jgi:hypothetical protein
VKRFETALHGCAASRSIFFCPIEPGPGVFQHSAFVDEPLMCPMQDIAAQFGVNRSTLYRNVAASTT